MLRDFAAVANGDEGPRAKVEQALIQFEQDGWRLMGPVSLLWRGERDEAVLAQGLDEQDARLVKRILELLAH